MKQRDRTLASESARHTVMYYLQLAERAVKFGRRSRCRHSRHGEVRADSRSSALSSYTVPPIPLRSFGSGRGACRVSSQDIPNGSS